MPETVEAVCVCGARPNFMKIAPVHAALLKTGKIRPYLVHTGQHYDERMSKLFFDDLGIPQPDCNLEVGSASHAQQTAEIMKRFEPVCLEREPGWVIVVGDVNSTIACALVAAKLQIKVAHVEAGLRSFDRTMPEEINRLLTDAISDLLFITEPSGVANLKNEGVAAEKIHLVGNVMIDTLLRNRAKADESDILETLKLSARNYAVVTLHRPSNVDDRPTLAGIIDALEKVAHDMPVIFPVHPRTRANFARLGLKQRIESVRGIRLIEPQGYLAFLKLIADSALVLTDSGGIQEETTILGVPCLTLRHNTERPVTIDEGTNRLTGPDPAAILDAYATIRRGAAVANVPVLWDGKAAERIADVLVAHS